MLRNNLKVYYWSPHISNVATVKSVIHSALSLKKYAKNIEVSILNIFGEWDNHKNSLLKEEILLKNINISNFFLKLKKSGYIISTLKYLVIFLFSLVPLYKTLKKEKPNFLIIHLITSLPLFLFTVFNFKTKLILRISGYPHLNKFRFLFWKIVLKKVYLVTVPTKETLEFLKNKFPQYINKLIFLSDPVLYLKEIRTKKIDNQIDEKFLKQNKFFLSIGRLTKQKNFLFLIKNFHKFILRTKSDYNLLIIGTGEDINVLQKYVNNFNLENRVFFKNYTENIFKYLQNCSTFILCSLWEDPGFVLIEAAYMEKIIISSDCRSGPKEFLNNGFGGYLYKSNNSDDLQNKLDLYLNEEKKNIIKKLVVAKKNCKNYTLFQHFIKLIPYLK